MVWIIFFERNGHIRNYDEAADDDTEDDYDDDDDYDNCDDIRIWGDGSWDVSWTYNHRKASAASDCRWRCGRYLDYDDTDVDDIDVILNDDNDNYHDVKFSGFRSWDGWWTFNYTFAYG